MRFDPIVRMPTAWSGVHRRFGVHLFQGEVTVGQMDELEVAGDRWRSANPGKLVELVVIHASAHQMTAAERTRMTQLIKRWEADRIASSTVILADGLMGSLHRSVLTGLMMIARPPHPVKVFGSVPESVRFLAPYVATLWGREIDAEDLVDAVSTFVAEFANRA